MKFEAQRITEDFGNWNTHDEKAERTGDYARAVSWAKHLRDACDNYIKAHSMCDNDRLEDQRDEVL